MKTNDTRQSGFAVKAITTFGRRLATVLVALPFLSGAPTFVQGAEGGDSKGGHGDLTTKATNPVGALVQLQLQNLYIPSSDNSSGYANTAIIQPVVPFDLGDDAYFQGIITRTTMPIVTTPEVNDNRETGVGDITSLAALTHTSPGSQKGEFFTWGRSVLWCCQRPVRMRRAQTCGNLAPDCSASPISIWPTATT